MKPLLAILLLAVAPACAAGTREDASAATPATAVRWETSPERAFARAKSEKKLVLLDLQAVWCHWCHVMEETTYRDPKVIGLLDAHFVTLQVDQDSRPDISSRYEDYGWPATILFDADGRELVKRSGYIPPQPFATLLQALVDDPTPGPSVEPKREIAFASEPKLTKDLRADLRKAITARYDTKVGGFGNIHKYIDPPSLEHLITSALDGDRRAETMAKQTLEAALQLIDPVWGGIDQYSAGGVWTEPHFEKIMSFQGDDLAVYALAYSAWKDQRWLKAAQDIRRFLKEKMTRPDGAFYTSQDADLVQGEHSGEYFALDDAGRRARGIPRIDTHVYARENGWAIRGLCAYAAATGDETAIEDARRAANWIVAHRFTAAGNTAGAAIAAGKTGGFGHDEKDAAGPYLGDTLSMGRAFLALYEVTGERAWLARASEAADFIARTFATTPPTSPASNGAGFRTSASSAGPLADATVLREENVALARFANRLSRYSAKKEHEATADAALRFLATREIALDGLPGGVLLAADEREHDPLHVTVVGKKSDAQAKALFRAARALPTTYARIEWFDASEGPFMNDDVPFPALEKPAAFVCVEGRCTSPAYEPATIAERVKSASGSKAGAPGRFQGF